MARCFQDVSRAARPPAPTSMSLSGLIAVFRARHISFDKVSRCADGPPAHDTSSDSVLAIRDLFVGPRFRNPRRGRLGLRFTNRFWRPSAAAYLAQGACRTRCDPAQNHNPWPENQPSRGQRSRRLRCGLSIPQGVAVQHRPLDFTGHHLLHHHAIGFHGLFPSEIVRSGGSRVQPIAARLPHRCSKIKTAVTKAASPTTLEKGFLLAANERSGGLRPWLRIAPAPVRRPSQVQADRRRARRSAVILSAEKAARTAVRPAHDLPVFGLLPAGRPAPPVTSVRHWPPQ